MYDFDRLDSDDVIGHLELDMWHIFDKNWAQEIDQTWPLGDDYGDVDKKVLQRAPANKEHVRLPLSSQIAACHRLVGCVVMLVAPLFSLRGCLDRCSRVQVYGTIRLRLSFHSADYASDESFSDDDIDVVVRNSEEEEDVPPPTPEEAREMERLRRHRQLGESAFVL